MKLVILVELLTLVSSQQSIYSILTSNSCNSSPPSIRNGVVIKHSKVLWGVVLFYATYRCNPCYELFGLSTIYCGDAGWPNSPPVSCMGTNPCNSNPCGRNAKCSSSSFCTASCRCRGGYFGNPRRGCEKSVCFPPDPPKNGRVSPSSRPGWTEGNVATYSCINGYQLDGHRQLTCSWRYSFSSPPSCVDVDECSMNTHNCGNTSTCINTEGSYICQCERGYRRNGESCTDIDECFDGTAACSAEAQCQNTIGSYNCICTEGFTEEEGYRCVGIAACSQPYGINNAEFSPDKSITGLEYPYDEGDVITWSCKNDSFEHAGRNGFTQICIHGYWSGRTPICHRSICSPPDPPENGRVSPSSRPGWTKGDMATYSCNDGYQLDGYRQLTCSSRDSFSSPPSCVEEEESSETKGSD